MKKLSYLLFSSAALLTLAACQNQNADATEAAGAETLTDFPSGKAHGFNRGMIARSDKG